MTYLLRLLLISAAAFLASRSGIAAETALEKTDVLQAIITAQKAREKLYNNMHGVWEISKRDVNGKRSGQTIEYWAREGNYFRVEWRPESRSGDVKPGVRVIVRPEGSVRYLIDSSADIGSVIEVDEADKNLWRVTGEHFYAQGNRTFIKQLWPNIERWTQGTSKADDLIVTNEGDDITELQVNETGKTAKAVTTIVLDSSNYLTRSASDEITYQNGSIDTDTIDFRYVSDHPEIPSDVKIMSVTSTGEESSESHTLTELSLKPAAVSVFDVDSSVFNRSSIGWGWSRRIVVLLVGVALLASYFYWQRKRSA